jgi:hypothetical protein
LKKNLLPLEAAVAAEEPEADDDGANFLFVEEADEHRDNSALLLFLLLQMWELQMSLVLL